MTMCQLLRKCRKARSLLTLRRLYLQAVRMEINDSSKQLRKSDGEKLSVKESREMASDFAADHIPNLIGDEIGLDQMSSLFWQFVETGK